MAFKIIIYTAAAGTPDLERTIHAISKRVPDAEFLVLAHRPARPIGKLVRNQFRNLTRHGWRWIPYQIGELLVQFKRRNNRPRRTPPAIFSVESFQSINGPEAIARAQQWQPDLGLAIAAPIIRERQFSIPRLGTLNIHKGKLPNYRGMPPAFWELWHGECEVGVTVHRVEKGLDTGDILLESRVPVEPHSTPAGMRVRLDEEGIRLLAESAQRMRDGNAVFRPQPSGGMTYTRPSLKQESQLARRGRPFNAARCAKNVVFNGYATLSRMRSGPSPKTVIFLYHRVNDTHRDSVTIGVQQFADHMRYLADHYEVVRLDEILEGGRASDGPRIAITFDDGYLDNYNYAAPILIKHQVPATFFVSTDHISHNLPFAHDLVKLGEGLPNMNWNQIREMHDAGFSIGSHTSNHINLAQSDSELVRLELRRSREALERELGLKEIMFAHPFGKRRDISAERLEQVKAEGYVCNCSAYGGVNSADIDRWDIRRQGIDHSFDIPALRAKIAGWKANVLA